jgi:hypothetical protein
MRDPEVASFMKKIHLCLYFATSWSADGLRVLAEVLPSLHGLESISIDNEDLYVTQDSQRSVISAIGHTRPKYLRWSTPSPGGCAHFARELYPLLPWKEKPALSLNIYGLYFVEPNQDLNGLIANIIESLQSTADATKHLSFGWVAGVPQLPQHDVYITGE